MQLVTVKPGDAFANPMITRRVVIAPSALSLGKKRLQEGAHNTCFQDTEGIPPASDNDAGEICVRLAILKPDNERRPAAHPIRMLFKGPHDFKSQQRVVTWLRVTSADNVAPGETEMVVFVDIVGLIPCWITAQQNRYNVRT